MTGGVLAAVAALAYLRQLFLGETFTLKDHLVFTLPARSALASSLAAGRLPEWWDGLALGVPMASNPNYGVTYPLAWLVALLPHPFGADFLLLLHAWVGGMGVAALSRRLGAGRAGSTLGGAVFMTCGYVVSMIVNAIVVLTLAWTPWAAWAADRLACEDERRQRFAAATVFAAIFALQIMSGDPAGVITSGVLCALVTLARARRRLPTLAWLVLAAGAAVPMAAVALVPAGHLLAESQRAGGLTAAKAADWSMHPLRLIELAWPHALGDVTSSSTGFASLIARAGARGVDPGWSASDFVGAPVLLLAILGASRSRPGNAGLLAASAFLLLLALGRFTPAYFAYRSLFLPERLIRFPEKHLAGALVLWCALAGVGFADAFSRARRARRSLMLFAGAAATVAVALAVLLALRPTLEAALSARAGHEGRPLSTSGALSEVLIGGLVLLVATAAVGLLIRLAWHPRLGKRAALAAWSVLVLMSCWHAWTISPVVDRDEITAAPSILSPALGADDALRPRLYRARTLATARTMSSQEHALALRDSSMDSFASPFGLAHFPGFDPAHSARYVAFWDEARTAPLERLLDLFDVRWAIVRAGEAERLSLPVRAHGGDDYVLVENERRRPRAFVAGRWEWLPTDAAVRARLLAPGPIDRSIVRLTGSGPAPGGQAPAVTPCAATSPRPEAVELDCDSSHGGYAVLLDAWAPGWMATVDGLPARIERADSLVRAVHVAPGRHAIVFRYRTPGLRAGAGVSAAAWLCWLGLAARARWSTRALRPGAAA